MVLDIQRFNYTSIFVGTHTNVYKMKKWNEYNIYISIYKFITNLVESWSRAPTNVSDNFQELL